MSIRNISMQRNNFRNQYNVFDGFANSKGVTVICMFLNEDHVRPLSVVTVKHRTTIL